MTTERSEHTCGPDCWYVAKRRGRHYRMRNRCTGAWDRWESYKPDAYSRQRRQHY
jgi:sarcosine oxidase gamma subunit